MTTNTIIQLIYPQGFWLICSAARSQVANINPASPFDGAPKWEFRVVSLDLMG